MSKNQNIILFIPDQFRNDALNHMGNEASITPNFDNIAYNEGISFQNAYCQNPVCVPSRISFLTGLYPHTTGHRTMHYLQNEFEPNILKEMKNNGYEVIWIGKNDVIPATISKENYCDEYYDGFSFENKVNRTDLSINLNELNPLKIDVSKEYEELLINSKKGDNYYSFYLGKLPNSEYYGKTDWNCLKSFLDYLERKSKEKDQKPFFVYCNFIFPHPPYGCEEPWYSSIDRKKLSKRTQNVLKIKNKPSMLYSIANKQNLSLWTEEKWDELRATYLAMVSKVDYQYGLIVEKLKQTNLYENTTIFIFSDHGDYTGDFNISEKVQNCFENAIVNVPLMIKPSNKFELKTRIIKNNVELVDIVATIAEICNLKLSYTQFGKSLVHFFKDDKKHKEAVFSEGGRIHGEIQAMEIGHNEKSVFWPRLSSQSSEGPEHTKAIMCKIEHFKYIKRLYENSELYDLKNDPKEINNLIFDSEYKELIFNFEMQISKWLIETADFVPNRRDKR